MKPSAIYAADLLRRYWLRADSFFQQREKITVCCIRLVQSTSSYLWYETDVNVTEVLSFHFKLELPEGLNKRHALYVSDCAS